MYQSYCPCYLHLYQHRFLRNCFQSSRDAASDNSFFQNFLGEDTPRTPFGLAPLALIRTPPSPPPPPPPQEKSWLRACQPPKNADFKTFKGFVQTPCRHSKKFLLRPYSLNVTNHISACHATRHCSVLSNFVYLHMYPLFLAVA